MGMLLLKPLRCMAAAGSSSKQEDSVSPTPSFRIVMPFLKRGSFFNVYLALLKGAQIDSPGDCKSPVYPWERIQKRQGSEGLLHTAWPACLSSDLGSPCRAFLYITHFMTSRACLHRDVFHSWVDTSYPSQTAAPLRSMWISSTWFGKQGPFGPS